MREGAGDGASLVTLLHIHRTGLELHHVRREQSGARERIFGEQRAQRVGAEVLVSEQDDHYASVLFIERCKFLNRSSKIQ